jgi:hypothetical protein
MRRIRHAPRGESVGGQEITELIVDGGIRYVYKRQQRQTECESESGHGETGQAPLYGEPPETVAKSLNRVVQKHYSQSLNRQLRLSGLAQSAGAERVAKALGGEFFRRQVKHSLG